MERIRTSGEVTSNARSLQRLQASQEFKTPKRQKILSVRLNGSECFLQGQASRFHDAWSSYV